ncbi:uncharacterized protein LOC126833295 [Adelges cooleyi]|uniref:uncharacterized protein LOC126833295 n=1 Tax=Adelges cooleyi TaxID=133065 RepID=UPI0021806276|nr:uncharacterized protein LOC126833295 [Adelges cooleyi]XP_050420506.1 uncharacterized protein LOC126833295 [Adelges cooleyi]
MAEETLEQRVAKFETFINDVLKESLKRIHVAVDMLNQEIMELEQTGNSIKTLSRLAAERPGKPLKTRVNVGCDFYMQANVEPHTYLVCVGLGHYLEFTETEATAFVRHRSQLLKARADELRDEGARVRAQITLALHCIQDLQNIN